MRGLRLLGITKRFGQILANDDISIDFHRGTVHAIVGENGAGKSTLMNILYGLYHPDSGSIQLDDSVVRISSPIEAIKHGIGMVHQHFKLVSCFSVAQNIVLGEEVTKKFLVLDSKKAEEKVQALSDLYNLHVDVRKKISEISVGMQQRVEILKCLYRKAQIIILDEPTAVLTPQEIDDLLDVVADLRKSGKTIIFISHKLKEVKKIADYITVIRHGKVVGEAPAGNFSIEYMAELMVGKPLEDLCVTRMKNGGENLLTLQDISYVGNQKDRNLAKINLKLKRGQILGLAGVDGNGQAEIVDIILGVKRPTEGRIILKDTDITNRKIHERRDLGLSHIPEDRHKNGLILDFSLKENLILGLHRRKKFSRMGILNRRLVDDVSKRLLGEFDIRPQDSSVMARSMSGGNQQKAIIAREVFSDPDLIIAVQPTRGLDIGAMRFVRDQLIQLRDNGRAVLLISLDLDEILLLSDRIAVISHGRIVAEADPETTSRRQLGIYMAGIGHEEEGAHDATT